MLANAIVRHIVIFELLRLKRLLSKNKNLIFSPSDRGYQTKSFDRKIGKETKKKRKNVKIRKYNG